MTVSGKILRKKVTPGQWGNSIMFVVLDHGQERMVSCFDNKLTEGAKSILQALVEGMYADFEVVESPSKKGDGKIYLNITSAMPITQLREDVPASGGETPAEVQPGGQPKAYHQDAPDSMILSYAKDGAIALIIPGESTDDLLAQIEALYKGMKSILAGE